MLTTGQEIRPDISITVLSEGELNTYFLPLVRNPLIHKGLSLLANKTC